MAIIKHGSVKNVRYADALEYMTYKHKEDQTTGHYEPILDEYGFKIPRDNCSVTYLTAGGNEADPTDWEVACMRTNLAYQKNLAYDDVKMHEYIISHPAEDREKMTMEDLLAEGKAFVRDCLPGYDALIAVHRDTDNDHIHITINSVRAVEREEQEWMEHDEDGAVCRKEVMAGGKHRETAAFRCHYNEWEKEYTLTHGLTVKDCNKAAAEHKSERHKNRTAELRQILLVTASESKNFPDFVQQMQSQHEVQVVRRGKTVSVIPPGREKPLRLRTLKLEPEDLYQLMAEEKAFYSPTVLAAVRETKAHNRAERKYGKWLMDRCIENGEKADDLLADTARLVAQNVEATGTPYKRSDFKELNTTLRQLVWLHRDLTTELDKLDSLIDKWNTYHDSCVSSEKRESAKKYLLWCGFHPDRKAAYEDLALLRSTVSTQIDHVDELRNVLTDTAADWRGANENHRQAVSLEYLTAREAKLQSLLADTRAKRERMGEIAYYCQKSASYHIFNRAKLAKAEHYYDLWEQYAAKEQQLEADLHRVQAEVRTAEKTQEEDPPARPD